MLVALHTKRLKPIVLHVLPDDGRILGDDRETQAIAAAFSRGDRIEAYARQWAAQYGYALQRLAHDPALADACLWIEHERLCRNPRTELARLGAHPHLDESDTQRLQEQGADQIHQAPASAFESGTLSNDETAPWTSTVWASAQEWASRPATGAALSGSGV